MMFPDRDTEEYQQNTGGHVLNGSVLGDVFGHFTVRCATYTRVWLCEHHQIHILAPLESNDIVILHI